MKLVQLLEELVAESRRRNDIAERQLAVMQPDVRIVLDGEPLRATHETMRAAARRLPGRGSSV